MTRDAKAAERKCDPSRRRPRPRWARLRVVVVLLLLLVLAGWRYGWPARSWETTVSALEELGWQEAARLVPRCISAESVTGGARGVLLAEGSLDERGNSVFDLDRASYIDPEILPLRRDVLSGLELPDLSGRRFRAGVFWVDMPAEYEDEPGDALDAALVYSVLLTCDESERWEDAAELIVDLNRNRDLTDDPVMTLSQAWSHEDENTRAKLNWSVRVFEPIALSRRAPRPVDEEAPAVSVRALPTLHVTYYNGEPEADRLHLALCPTSYRKGRLIDGGRTREVVISPDRTRFGRFDGPWPTCWRVDGDWTGRSPLTAWRYERGTFWGCTLDADGRKLRDGPYEGPTGTLRVETAGGEPLRIRYFSLWLRGSDPHQITSWGWAPVPRFSSLTLPQRQHPLPVGDCGIDRLMLVHGSSSTVQITTSGHRAKPSPPEFSIEDGRLTVYRLPKTLQFEAYAVIEERPRPYVIDWVWSSDEPSDQEGEWKGPRPGSDVKIGVSLSDPATENEYSIYCRGNPPPESLRLVIRDASGNKVHQDTMEYG